MKWTLLLLCVALYVQFSTTLDVKPVQGGASGSATTTRYWDCCKPTCSWKENINKNSPIDTCAKDGVTKISANIQSGCDSSGSAYMCNALQPWIVNSTFALGYVAGTFEDAPTNMCCECLLIQFQKGGFGQDLTGKSMVVQVTNTGDSASTSGNKNHFDVQLPGGGVGYFTEGCKSQWNAPEQGWGDQYGGVHEKEDCSQLPQQLQPGCLFRWDWMGGASNPPVTFQQVECPDELVAKSGCK